MPSITIKITVEDEDFTQDQLVDMVNTIHDQLLDDQMFSDFPEFNVEVIKENTDAVNHHQDDRGR